MALPVVNSQNSVDASTIQQTVLNAAAKTGKLQINNSGSINFTNYVQGGTQTATKESTNFISEAGNRVLGEIRNLLVSLNNNIGKFIQTANIEKSVAANLAEAAAPKDVDETGRYRLVDLRDDFKTIINGLGEKLSYDKEGRQRGDSGIGGFKGFSGNLLLGLATVFRSLAKAVPLLAGAYVINMLTGGKLEKYISKLSDTVLKEISGVFGGETGTGTGGQINPEPGEMGNTGGNVNTGPTPTPSTGTETPSITPRPERTETPTGSGTNPSVTRIQPKTKLTQKTNSAWASESDLVGLDFTNHSNSKNGHLPLEVEKQILKALAERVQYIRRKLGGIRFKVNSGYRPPGYRAGVAGSLHKKRMAIDISTIGMSTDQKRRFVIAASECGIGGIGIYTKLNFIHIDIGKVRWWVGEGDSGLPDWAKDIITNHVKGKYRSGEVAEELDSKKTSTPTKDDDKEPGEQNNNGGDVSAKEESKKDTSSNVTAPKSTTSRVIESVGNAIGSVLGISDANATQDITNNNPSEGLQMPSGGMQPTQTATKQTKKISSGQFPENIERAFTETEQRYQLPKGLLKAIANAETGHIKDWNKRIKAVSPAGAVGLMQFMPGTAKEMGLTNRTNPEESVRAAGKYFNKIRNIIGSNDPKLLAAGYNAGPNRKVLKEGKIPNFTETKKYVAKVAAYTSTTANDTIITQKDNKITTESPRPSTNTKPNTADTTTTEQQPESELDQLKSMIPGAEKLAIFGDEEKLLPLLMSSSNKDINNVVSELMSSVKNVGDKLRSSIKESQGDIDTNTFKAIIEQNDPRKNLIPETASVAPTPEANKGEQLNEEAKNLETARTKALYESNKKDLSPVMTPNPPSVAQKRSDNPPVNSTMGVNKMALRNDDEPTLFRLLVKALDIGNVA